MYSPNTLLFMRERERDSEILIVSLYTCSGCGVNTLPVITAQSTSGCYFLDA